MEKSHKLTHVIIQSASSMSLSMNGLRPSVEIPNTLLVAFSHAIFPRNYNEREQELSS